MRGGTVRTMTAAGILAVVMLSALGPSMAAAFEAAEDQSWPAAHAPIEPVSEPAPPQAPPPRATPPHPTPKTKPAPTPKAKPKAKPTPVQQTPSQQQPGAPQPGNPDPVRPDEPPAAPVAPPGNQPFIGPGSTPTTGQGAPLPPGLEPPSRVQLVVAGATVSGIAAVAAWLVLGVRRREQAPVHTPQPPATTVTQADGMQLDLEVVVNRPPGAPQPRYSGRVPAAAGTTLWRDEDDRPRWVRRFDDQGPPPRRVPRSPLGPDEDAMPWLAGVTWPADDDHSKN